MTRWSPLQLGLAVGALIAVVLASAACGGAREGSAVPAALDFGCQ